MRSLLFSIFIAFISTTSTFAGDGEFKVVQTFKIGGEGRWDYITIDPATHRLYVPRTDRVMILSATDGKLLGTFVDTPGVHGVALVPELGRAFTSNGGAGTVTGFDTKTFAKHRWWRAGGNPDAILFDPASKKIFAFNGKSHDLSAIDPSIDPEQARDGERLDLGGKPEFAVADGGGQIFVNIEDTHEVVRIDSKNLKVTARWPLAPGEEPTGLAMDVATHRLFVGCHNQQMIVMDSESGNIVTTLPIGSGVDGVAFDPTTHLAFASCGDGTLTVVKEESADKFLVVQTVATAKGARTLTIDPQTHRIYLPTAEFVASDQESRRPQVKPDSFVILVVDRP